MSRRRLIGAKPGFFLKSRRVCENGAPATRELRLHKPVTIHCRRMQCVCSSFIKTDQRKGDRETLSYHLF